MKGLLRNIFTIGHNVPTLEGMTADVTPLPQRRLGDDANDTVRRTIRAAMAGQGLKVEQLAPMVGLSPSTIYRKFAGRGSAAAFTAGEVAELAAALELEIADVYAGRLTITAQRSDNLCYLTPLEPLLPPAA